MTSNFGCFASSLNAPLSNNRSGLFHPLLKLFVGLRAAAIKDIVLVEENHQVFEKVQEYTRGIQKVMHSNLLCANKL